MKSFKYTGLLFLLLAMTSSIFAQQGAILKPMELDSARLKLNPHEYEQSIPGSYLSQPYEKNYFLGFKPNFDYNQGYKLNLDFFNFNDLPLMGFSSGGMNTFNSPFFHNGVILSEGAYSLNNKLVFGGFSYGANSIFSAPSFNPQMNNFDTYGSTIFMQYKVSKKFKIETRFNFSNSPGPHF